MIENENLTFNIFKYSYLNLDFLKQKSINEDITTNINQYNKFKKIKTRNENILGCFFVPIVIILAFNCLYDLMSLSEFLLFSIPTLIAIMMSLSINHKILSFSFEHSSAIHFLESDKTRNHIIKEANYYIHKGSSLLKYSKDIRTSYKDVKFFLKNIDSNHINTAYNKDFINLFNATTELKNAIDTLNYPNETTYA